MLLVFCILLLCGCENTDNNEISDEEIDLKYKEMKNKLIEYGKLVYENEQWLNDEAVETTTAMKLKDLSERNGYDISMFVNPETNEQCDLENTRIEFIISDVTDLNHIKYEFNPILVCGDEDIDYTEENDDNGYINLHNQFVDYTEEFYDIENMEDKNLSVGEYKLTLNDLKNEGYDISMFINPNNGKQCDLEKSYSLLNVIIVDGEKEYIFNYYLNCD